MNPDSWSAAIFAHNEEANIIACLNAVLTQSDAEKNKIFVLINGSRDRTEHIVHDYAKFHSNVVPVKIVMADKANAWNEYIHNLAPPASVHIFIDGDTQPLPGAFVDLASTLKKNPDSRAVGGLPASGRDREGWSLRMMKFGRLAGCLYALRGSYVDMLRSNGIRLPTGLIGEDLFLSCLVKEQFDNYALMFPSPYLIFAPAARFWFRSLSRLRLADWITYARRLTRYQIRDFQLALLLNYLTHRNVSDIPSNVHELYRQVDQLPSYQWRGRMTPFHVLAIRNIRKCARGKMASDCKHQAW